MSSEETLQIKRLTLDATLPTRASPGSVGYDLYSLNDLHIEPNSRDIVSTGVCATIPMGCYGRIAPRSGLTVKYGIHVGAGVIDPDYTGELKVCLFNLGSVPFEIKKGDKIAQLILEKCMTPLIEEVNELQKTMRANRGFGSSG
jgi:dUTP pyrophosphatase|tara:strand:+ start:1460 stop:1891 length:432 start_codon:yes stop_codon:yes gene_type:complete